MSTIINLADDRVQAVFVFDDDAPVALSVVNDQERVQSWWSSRASAEDLVATYRGGGLREIQKIPENIQNVIDRRWATIEEVRKQTF